MKYLILVLCIAASFAMAQPEPLAPLVCSGVTTSTTAITATGDRITGYVVGLQVAISPANATATVSVATSGNLAARTIYSGSATGTKMVRPVVVCSTNGYDMAAWQKEFLAADKLVVTAGTLDYTNTAASATVTVIPVIERQP